MPRFKDAESLFEGRQRGNQFMASGQRLTAEDLRLLWASPKMKEITWLDLDDNVIGDEGLIELSQCDHLENVQYLNLNKNGVTDKGVKALAESTKLPKLKRLHLKNNPIEGRGVVSLFNSTTLESLSVFQIHDGWTCKKKEGWRYSSNL
jgi:Ran GTPase-activating protein (RanGAP) involved in mRNA processing and transport